MGKIFIICIVLLGIVNGLTALPVGLPWCPPCELLMDVCVDPQPCPSNTVMDPCGCCEECAKVEGEMCGGSWDIDGKCADGLTCVKPETSIFDLFYMPGICHRG
ncbi:HTRA3 [Branchiostoma lanceolatum]|uniref:HTRA3 protein n=1 Tax=Branchiostoma lanceolatum TaxID=7740 RepID=A0A8K0ED77_BRALA|nr:HTRA3 [Branchiostoma lanceolatum]